MANQGQGGQGPAVVVGTGAIGSVLGAALEARGIRPLFVGRQGPAAYSATVHGAGEASGSGRLLCVKAPSREELAAATLVFFTVKAMDLVAAFKWTKLFSPGAVLISLANGAVWELIAKEASSKPEFVWRLGFATFGATALGPQEYAIRAKRGEIVFGPLPALAKSASGRLQTAAEKAVLAHPRQNPVFSWQENVAQQAVLKWLFNVVINSLTAARRLPKNGDLLSDIPSLAAVFDEAYNLAEEVFSASLEPRASVYKVLLALVESTAENENSMARDVRLARPVEHAFLGGVVRSAKNPSHYPLLRGLDAVLSGA